MPAAAAASQRHSFVLHVPRHDFSLTKGTDIPAPPDSPPTSIGEPRQSTPPTSLGGPLTSHPTNDSIPKPMMHIPGAFPPSPTLTGHLKHSTDTNTTSINRDDTPQSPTSPTSETNMPSSPSQRRPPSVRRLFSLTSLRQSFSSSRTSFSLNQNQRPDTSNGSFVQRAESPSIMSTTPSAAQTPFFLSSSKNRPGTSASLRKRRSSNWFKRKSGFFTNTDDLDVLSEDGPEHKRFKDAHSLPVLPEIGTLSGGELDGGNIGWDEHLFERSNGFT
ncbi:uncharacterized protein MYCFIDRAFT_213406 [Pseudocercospora fijiensis CIRAD86]|uniref:Uncharacterized protein n=1 Tax=Pseudocercospora fijiensis (strain CIRAD86) TaxID=383855 RepID=N1QAC5_PSEFD|nr:uncharacterized protein MYCFIDRAFT_213406 [Pseudocercospora fijiensis CIRAD86]EME88766.1 hypothetical protein MYCFIDRAFT_213406 [Pseudocercospora fijiensis CIRAD86]